jgi:glycosyltransferase involved in cell wall biosynthesis
VEPRPFVSVIVPVYNAAAELRACLAALDGQSYPAERFETIVVDNGSEEPMRQAIGEWAGVRWLTERRPGSYAARNRGLEEARGDVIAFTDADCRADPQWLEQGLERLRAAPRAGLVGGGIDLSVRDPRRATAVELYERLTAFPQERYLEVYGFAATANLFTTREVVERVGPFDARLSSGGDNEWAQRVTAAGYERCYAAGARVAHPARSSLAELGRKIARVTGGIYVMRRQEEGAPWGRAWLILTAFLPPFRMLGLVFDRRLTGVGQRVRVLCVVFWAKYRRAFELLRLAAGGRAER